MKDLMAPYPQKNERNERNERFEGPAPSKKWKKWKKWKIWWPRTLKEMKEMKEMKDLKAPHPQRNERNERNGITWLWSCEPSCKQVTRTVTLFLSSPISYHRLTRLTDSLSLTHPSLYATFFSPTHPVPFSCRWHRFGVEEGSLG